MGSIGETRLIHCQSCGVSIRFEVEKRRLWMELKNGEGREVAWDRDAERRAENKKGRIERIRANNKQTGISV